MTTASRRLKFVPSVFAAAGLTAAIVGAAGTVIVRYVSPVPIIGAFGFNEGAMVGYVISGLTWASIGALLVVRRPMNAVGWLVVVIGAGYALSQLSVTLTFAFAAEGTARGDRLAQFAGWVTVLLQLVTILQVAIGFIFPSGRVQSRGWARFTPHFWTFAVVFSVLSLVQPGPLQLIPGVQNPFGVGPDLRGDQLIAPILTVFALIIMASLGISMVSRYRAAGRVERQQMKWFVLALGLAVTGLGIAQLQPFVMNRPTDAIGLSVFVFGGALVPVAIGIAILRHHLYDIDRIISRTLGYGIVTAVLFALFWTVNLALQEMLSAAAQSDPLVIAGSTLLVAALFQPIRRRVQAVVDRRFNRARYDAEQTVERFSGRLRDELDLSTLARELQRTTSAAVQPTTSSVWLRESSPHARGGAR